MIRDMACQCRICRNPSHRRRTSCALESRAKIADHSSRGSATPRTNSVQLALDIATAEKRGRHINSAVRGQLDLQARSDWGSYKRWTNHSRKRDRNSKHWRADPTHDLTHTGHSGSTAYGNMAASSSAYKAQRRGTMHERCDANWSLNNHPQRANGKVVGERRALESLIGTTLARGSQAQNTELAIASVDKAVSSSSKNVAGVRVAPDREEMNAQMTMPSAKRGKMDAQVVDIKDTEREFQADLPPRSDGQHGDKSEGDLL